MKPAISVAVVLILVAAAPLLAGFDIEPVTSHTADCHAPAAASSPDNLTMLAYVADGDPVLMSFVTTQLVPTHPVSGEVRPAPVTINSGSSPRICYSREGFVLAFASGGMVFVYESDLEGNWDLVNFAMLPSGGEVMGLDLWGAPSLAAGPYAFLTVEVSTNPPYQDFKVLYSAGTVTTGWSSFEVVAEEETQQPRPQMTFGIGPAGPWPRIFYLTSAFGGVDLVYTTKDLAAGWSAPTVVPGDGASGSTPIDGSFDVVTSYGISHNVLGLGPPLACPCGSIHYLAKGLGGGWDPQVDLTVNHLEYDWPRSPCLGADLVNPAGQVHAFWMQEGSGYDLEPKTRTLEYWVKTQAGWLDAGGFLDGQDGGPLGDHVALDVSPAGSVVMAWTRRDTIGGVPQAQQVWMARPHEPSDVPGSGKPVPEVSLSAWPNPFNPRVRLAMEATVAGSGTLDIYDVSGRHVTRLFAGDLPAGRREVAWDGRNSKGLEAPSGVYFALLESESGRVVRKLLLAE